MQPKKQSTVIFGGGLDQVTPTLLVEPGRLLLSSNFESDLNGGYRRIEGFERLDGQASPTDSSWFALKYTTIPSSVVFTIGETVLGLTSGATGVVLDNRTEGVYIVQPTGTFVAAETIQGQTSTFTEVISTTQLENIAILATDDTRVVRYAKELFFRDLIGVVPEEGTIVGDNPVRGQFKFLGDTFAIRDFSATEARLYIAGILGWGQFVPGHQVFADSITSKDDLESGLFVNDGNGNSALIVRAGFKTFGGTEAYLIFQNYITGFNAGDDIRTGSMGATKIATCASNTLQVTLPVGGKWEFVTHNFFGGINTFRVYMCNGTGSAFEFDGDVLAPILTDQDFINLDIPKYVRIHKNTLWLGYERGIVRGSEPGDPFLWDASLSSIELGVGAPVTGMDTNPDSLIIITTRQTQALFGDDITNYELRVIAENTGAKDYTTQHIGTTYMLDDRGIIELTRVLAFGSFENATISRSIQPAINQLLDDINVSSFSLRKNSYRLFTSDGRGIYCTFQEGQVVGFTVVDLQRDIFSMTNAEDEKGVERILFGGNDGFVYELDKGRTYDGVAVFSFLRPAFHYAESPTIRKRFYRAFFDVVITGRATISVVAEYSNGSSDSKSIAEVTADTAGLAGLWDIDNWDEAIFDAKLSADAYIDLTGTGDSIGLILTNESTNDDVFTIKDVIYHYKVRRTMRSER